MTASKGPRQSRWALGLPFVVVHLACAAAFFSGFSVAAVVALGVSYVTRAFGITAFYHRCLAHRAFRARRPVQLVGAVLGAAAAQRGPLWWAAHHREHHLYTDREGDPHSPVVDGFLYSHVLWIFARANAATRAQRVEDLARFPELVFLDRFEYLAPGALLGSCLATGAALQMWAPGLHTGPLQMAVWGFFVPTVALYHCTF
ncbi:MAG TPA: fatty acid desaturase, partial [Acidimicrobiales bacterium]|nr:fatty acid desaturase [Acidimicrobiales bacterium]